MQIVTISPRELAAKRQGGESIELIDVRTPLEFREVHSDLRSKLAKGEMPDPGIMRPETARVLAEKYKQQG